MHNYTVYHLHSDLSNGTTNIDSVTKYTEYVERAKELGMTSLAFSEHGNVFEWYFKKKAIEDAGMKFIFAVEAYLTSTLEDKVRDNYHCVLIARNYEGVKEINRMMSAAYNRNDNHFYYYPRISFDEIENTSENVIITTACLGGALHAVESANEVARKKLSAILTKKEYVDSALELINNFGQFTVTESKVDPQVVKGVQKANDLISEFTSKVIMGKEDSKRFLNFLIKNKERVFLEIQHHNVESQRKYNQYLYDISKKYGIPLIAGTDTHALNERHLKGRSILQKSKNVHFDNEDAWDLTMKSYDELCEAYWLQNSLPEEVWMEAIENTNVMANMVEPFEMDYSNKYPNIYENPDEEFTRRVYEAIDNHPYALKNHSRKEIEERVEEELDAYKKTGASPYMLLKHDLHLWEVKNGIKTGPGRGSVSGSEGAYLLGITDMDSIKFDLNFFRFINPDRISLADIDTDYGEEDREKVKKYLLEDHMGDSRIKTSEIITFNTIATKGAIRDVARALGIDLVTVSEICNSLDAGDKIPDSLRNKWKELFEYVDIVSGTIVSIGSHPCGILVSDRNINEEVGLCTTSGSKYPVSCLYMKELDELNWVKWDVLGLDNVSLINETCKSIGIPTITPDSIPLDDMDVWRDIRDDTTMIFQFESESAQRLLKKIMSDETIEKIKKVNPNLSMIKLMSFANGLIRPSCSSFRDDVADGIFYDNGLKELNEFLAPEMGHVTMQETIMKFLVKFCGFSNSESDTARRAIGKKQKEKLESLLPDIEKRFIEQTHINYDVPIEKCQEVIKPFIQTILDASSYAFSWNHSDAYSCIGYISGYLRHYYPLEFVSAALNVFSDNEEKTANIINFANRCGIKMRNARFGRCGADYFFDKENKAIYKGAGAIKFMNNNVANEIFELSQKKTYNNFAELAIDLTHNTSINTRQLDILIKLDYFVDFGNSKELLRIVEILNMFKWGDAKTIKKDKIEGKIGEIVAKYSDGKNKNGTESKSYKIIDCLAIIKECSELIKSLQIQDFSLKEKAATQQEYLGHVSLITEKEEDRPKLYVKSMYSAKRKSDGKQFGVNIVCQSIGSGKQTRYTVFENDIKKYGKFNVGDIILCVKYTKTNGYFNIREYKVLW